MKPSRFHVTDHAVIRYLERVLEIDIEAHRREIIRQINLAEDHPTSSGVTVNGFRYRFVENAVVTVTKANHANKNAAKAFDRRVIDDGDAS